MRTIRRTTQFKKDVKRMGRRGKNFEEFKEVIGKLISGRVLETKYRDHYLVGQYKGSRECHIEPDWLLIYEITDDELVLIRTGTHSDLFR
jgi:mRNA interferase YafQ